MVIDDIRQKVVEVIRLSMDLQENGLFSGPEYDIQEAIPDFDKIFNSPDFYDLRSIYHLLVCWSEAANNHSETLGYGVKITVKEAEKLLIEAEELLSDGKCLTDPLVMDFGRKFSGDWFPDLVFRAASNRKKRIFSRRKPLFKWNISKAPEFHGKKMICCASYGDYVHSRFLHIILNHLAAGIEFSNSSMIIFPKPISLTKDIKTKYKNFDYNFLTAKFQHGNSFLHAKPLDEKCPVKQYIQIIDEYMHWENAFISMHDKSNDEDILQFNKQIHNKNLGFVLIQRLSENSKAFFWISFDDGLFLGLDDKISNWPSGIEFWLKD